ncbi:MAG: geranylgeranylglycerol-phosphate geranylgeranyltransferase [Flavobacteriaceae bacterium]|jgi:4-hydroxybenzoate polyprenyltransferase|nr:geranylgeranylglycerol-phosphate geranylgeranyltransferase [Flavobacteriaceae bacterium]
MLNRKNKLLLWKIVSLFSVVRGYNILIIAISQYLSAIFILAPERGAMSILLDWQMFVIVLATSLSIASGYIINNYYDWEKDLINRPKKTMLDRLISEETRLRIYFGVNFVVFLLALLISWRSAVFFSVYIFLIWFYSHKLKKYPIIGNATASLLAILPFFAVLFYFQKEELFHIQYHKYKYFVIFAHASFLYLLIFIREMIKDLQNLTGDFANNYRTIPVVYGEKTSKYIITFLTVLTVIPVYILIEKADVGYMDIYFYGCFIALLFFLIFLWNSKDKKHFMVSHNLLKLIIILGVFSIVLIEPSILWKGKHLLPI